MRSFASIIALAGAAVIGTIGMSFAEQSGMDMGARTQALTTIPANAVSITNWYKENVYDPGNSKVGEIIDVLVGTDGKVDALIVSVGGFIGINEKDVAVTFASVNASERNGKWHLTMDTTKDALKTAPAYKYDRSRTTWVLAQNMR